ncbi:hypothetical protein [Caldivirga sp.]|uniref:hypothetical protein n=1 Tax=Caldivirga sp. TaxID=2080243 RepID=UPI0025C07308|nr:hypothetical protein [Caldivirga sp.]
MARKLPIGETLSTKGTVDKLVSIVRRMVPEHGRSTYGEPERVSKGAVGIMDVVLKSPGLN